MTDITYGTCNGWYAAFEYNSLNPNINLFASAFVRLQLYIRTYINTSSTVALKKFMFFLSGTLDFHIEFISFKAAHS